MKKQNIYQLSTCALMTALMCVLGPMSIPIGPIPVSLTNFTIFFAVYLLGMRDGTISYIVYLFLGAAGLPVFSGYQGGVAKIAGPTGGYLIGFILTALIAGYIMERFHGHTVITIIGMVVAMLAAYLSCIIWFVFQTQCDVWYALTTCVLPFVLIDMVKILLVIALGKTIRHALAKADLLTIQKGVI